MSTLRFEFDAKNKILLARFEGRVIEELVAESRRAIKKYSTLTGARVGIWDTSAGTELAVSDEFIRQLAKQANQEPAFSGRSVIVAPTTSGFGVARMFQIAAEIDPPLLTVVHSMDEAFAALGVQSPHFEPLE